MNTDNVVKGIVAGVSIGFSIGVGYILAQRLMGKWAQRRANGGASNATGDCGEGCYMGARGCICPEKRQAASMPMQYFAYEGKEPKRKSTFDDFDFTTGQGEW